MHTELAGGGIPLSDSGRGPFVHKFATPRHKYLFDVNTSRILRVPPVVWEVVDDFGALGREELIARHGSTYSSAAVTDAYDAILSAQQKGLFLSNRPSQTAISGDEAHIRERLAGHRASVSLVVTEQCNFRCAYCVYGGSYTHQRTHSKAMMSWETAKRALDEFIDHSGQAEARAVHFYGGEPLLNLPLIRQSMEYVHKVRQLTDVEFAMTTNGSLLEGEAADLLARYRTRIVVSLDGPEHVHDRYRRLADGSGTWQRIMRNLRLFLDRFPEYRSNHRLRFHTVLAPPVDLQALEDFFASCNLLTSEMGLSLGTVADHDTTLTCCAPFDGLRIEGYHALYQRFIRNIRDGILNEQSRQPALWLQTALFEKDVLMFYKRGYASPQRPCLPDVFCPLPMCMPGVRRLYVNTDGSYYPCERVQETPTFCIGSVDEGVSPRKVRDLLQAFVDLGKEECRSCWCLPMCTAGCVVSVMKDGKLDPGARKEACESCRQRTHRIMTDVCEALETSPRALQYMDSITLS